MSRKAIIRIFGWVVLGALLCSGLMNPPSAVAKDKDKGKKKQVAIDPSRLAWPPPPAVARIKFIASYTGDDVKPKQKQGLLERLAGIPEESNKSIMLKPYGVACDSKGRAYVTDTQHRLVFVFDFDKKDVEYRGDKPPANLKTPIGIAIDSTDKLYVSDSANHNITAFDPNGAVLEVFGENELQKPAGMAIDEALDRLYVADSKVRRIAIFDLKKREFVKWMGKSSNIMTEKEKLPDDSRDDLTALIAPANLVVDGDGLLYISDAFNAQIIVMDTDGNEVKKIGELGDGPGQFGRPRGIALDVDGHLYVADAMSNNVQMFTADSKPLMPLGRQGSLPGEFAIPAGVAVDKFNRLIVADQYNRRIQVFRYVTDEEAKAEQAKQPTKVAEAKK